MKTIKIKNENKKTRVFALILVLLLSVCCALFAGCSIVDPDTWDDDSDSGSSGSGSGSGSGTQTAEIVPNKFKMGYRGTAQDTNVAENIKTLAETLVEDFASSFGAGKKYKSEEGDETTLSAGYKSKEGSETTFDYTSIYYFDSIRYQAYVKYSNDVEDYIVIANTEKRWNWSFENTNIQPIFRGAANGMDKSSYEGSSGANSIYKNKYDDYLKIYTNLYSEAMEVVLYEILLGKTDYQNIIVVGSSFDSNGYPQVTYRGQSVSVVDGKLDFSSILTTLKAEYFDKATYFGFSISDGTKIKNYIINYVIGESAHKDEGGADQLDDNRHYNDYVQALVDGLINSETEYYWYARTGFKDGRLAISSTGDYFQLVPKAEYQSLVLMAEEEDEFSFCWIAFQSTRDLNINMYFRYYDNNTNTIRTSTPKKIVVEGGAYDMWDHDTSDMDFGTDSGYYAIDVFDNNDVVAAPTARSNSGITEIYKPVASKNGFGSVSVFNEANVNCSFLEIVLDVEKSADDPVGTDYSFQVALFSLIFKSDLDSLGIE